MNSNNILVQEYLSSLKEDRELDYLFPLLLNSMRFRIVQTASDSKGQSQYGKDVIAIGKDEQGFVWRWYFELKGYDDKDITDKNYSKKDGIRESIIEAKDTAFKDSSINNFNNLPIKIVVVHNGILKANLRPTFEGFVEREFKPGEFERWDIYHLTSLFSDYLFSEYLLTDSESNRLFKKTLAFLDTPDYNYLDFMLLVSRQYERFNDKIGIRHLSKLFATLNLLERLVYHFSLLNNNIVAAKECSKYIVIKTWSWILDNKLEKRKPVVKEFKKLLRTQHEIFGAYFKKTFKVANMRNGLFAENIGYFELIGYPLRCFDYLEDIIYFCRLRLNNPDFNFRNVNAKYIHNKQKDLLIELIYNNSGFLRPLLDNHSIAISQLILFFLYGAEIRLKDKIFVKQFLINTIHNIMGAKLKHNILPELGNNIEHVMELFTSEVKEEYNDSSSLLIPLLLELLVVFDMEKEYNELEQFLNSRCTGLSLQTPYPKFEFDVEQLLFEKHMHYEYITETIDPIPNNFDNFKRFLLEHQSRDIDYRTDQVGFSFIRYLSHSFYKNEFHPQEWRHFIDRLK